MVSVRASILGFRAEYSVSAQTEPKTTILLRFAQTETQPYLGGFWRAIIKVYYESLKRELKTKTIYGYRCDERLIKLT